MKLTGHIKSVLLLNIVCLAMISCSAVERNYERPFTDAEEGIMMGAAIGVLAGLTTKNKKKKAVLYGVVGGITDDAMDSYVDSQKKELERQLQTQIRRGDITVYKLPNNLLIVTMTAQVVFNTNSTNINAGFRDSMENIAGVLKKYRQTHLSLVGHTDHTGSQSHNQKLSVKRARSVYDYLSQQNIIDQRLAYYGMGEDKPRADNTTKRGRMLNRRVEIVIEPIREP